VPCSRRFGKKRLGSARDRRRPVRERGELVGDELRRCELAARTPDPDDRRKVMVALTPKGLATADAANLVYKRERERLLADLSDDEVERLDAALGRLLDVLSEDARARL